MKWMVGGGSGLGFNVLRKFLLKTCMAGVVEHVTKSNPMCSSLIAKCASGALLV